VSSSIFSKIGRNLHQQPLHPLHTIKSVIHAHLHDYQQFDDFSPVVPIKNCFDDLLIPADHVSRSVSDTYYVDKLHCLRTHTSAHQSTLLSQGVDKFVVTGDVYRRDEIDSTHYPVFHQMEGVKLFDEGTSRDVILDDLKATLEGLSDELFGNCEKRWIEAYFPFTDPSLELEIYYNGEWLEVLGCGVIQSAIISNAGQTRPGWAFGLGLERLAMVLFDIPDIRLFWSNDERFSSQFSSGKVDGVKFVPYSKYPECYKDVSFWLPRSEDGQSNVEVHQNDICEIVRGLTEEDLIEKVTLESTFTHPKTNRESQCFRLTYRSMDRSLTNEEIDALQFKFRDELVKQFGVELR
jgi:phenylalanyl-tRNA synthetase alpha chain